MGLVVAEKGTQNKRDRVPSFLSTFGGKGGFCLSQPLLNYENPNSMTFPQQLHDIINDPVKEKAVLDLIQRECLKEYGRWRDADYENTDGPLIGIGSLAASANLLCQFLGIKDNQ